MADYGHIVRPPMREANHVPLIPCAWNERGVSVEVCSQTTSVLVRNERGCCAAACTSAVRACRMCLREGKTPEKVVDAVRGLCWDHARDKDIPKGLAEALDVGYVLPDLAPAAVLRARLVYKRVPAEDTRKRDPVLFKPKHYRKLIPGLKPEQDQVLRLVALGLDDFQIAKRTGFAWTRVMRNVKEMNKYFGLDQLGSRSRRAVLVGIGNYAKKFYP